MIRRQRSSGVDMAIATTTVASTIVRAVDACGSIARTGLQVDRKSETCPRSSMHKNPHAPANLESGNGQRQRATMTATVGDGRRRTASKWRNFGAQAESRRPVKTGPNDDGSRPQVEKPKMFRSRRLGLPVSADYHWLLGFFGWGPHPRFWNADPHAGLA
ncbi:hypothetical protein BDW42DRAFT_195023 [Aspergillus taichungensis]|uniref:Uncharacterized protein n=1 Tax=Aspergillus taichungensis TaxID=482145 RepID=A0A2J5HQX4_9EURO|nr:hypothetical protein BDW42DRAFT_195023 [Aspergillus taichungensis]